MKVGERGQKEERRKREREIERERERKRERESPRNTTRPPYNTKSKGSTGASLLLFNIINRRRGATRK